MLVNRAAMKRYILERCRMLRPGWMCTRVSGRAIAGIDGLLKAKIDGLVAQHPTLGKTFDPWGGDGP